MDVARILCFVAGVVMLFSVISRLTDDKHEQQHSQVMGMLIACFTMLLAIYIRLTF